jgi:hypothetical protein
LKSTKKLLSILIEFKGLLGLSYNFVLGSKPAAAFCTSMRAAKSLQHWLFFGVLFMGVIEQMQSTT